MDINEKIKQCAKDCGMATYLYARIREVNLTIEDIKEYPFLWRQFNDQVKFSKIEGLLQRSTTFHFLDQLCGIEPDTEADVLPITNEMEAKCYKFLKLLKERGCDINLSTVSMTPTIEYAKHLDSYLAGVRCDVTMTYRAECNE